LILIKIIKRLNSETAVNKGVKGLH